MALDALFGAGRRGRRLRRRLRPGRARRRVSSTSRSSRAGQALSLSSMPRLRATPNGFNEWLICEAIAWARAHGYRHVSLNFSPFAALLAPEPTHRAARSSSGARSWR